VTKENFGKEGASGEEKTIIGLRYAQPGNNVTEKGWTRKLVSTVLGSKGQEKSIKGLFPTISRKNSRRGFPNPYKNRRGEVRTTRNQGRNCGATVITKWGVPNKRGKHFEG